MKAVSIHFLVYTRALSAIQLLSIYIWPSLRIITLTWQDSSPTQGQAKHEARSICSSSEK